MKSQKTLVTFQTSQRQRDELAKVAAEHDRSISAELRRAVDLHLRVNARDDRSRE
jgi:hypothetical protein